MGATVALWWLDIEAAAPALDALDAARGLLTDEERTMFSRERRAVRCGLRVGLAAVGGVEAARSAIGSGERGRPVLTDRPNLQFSVSHAAGVGLIAIAMAAPLGVDIERARIIRLSAARRARLLEAGVRHGLVSGSTPASDASFLALWTRLEAIGKARGDGIGGVLAAIGAVRSTDRDFEADRVMPDGGVLETLQLPEGFLGALVRPERVPMGHVQRLPTDVAGLERLCDGCTHV